MATFGERLKYLREKDGLLQKELAAKIDVAVSTIATWEIGHRIPEVSKLEALANYFRCSVDYLLGRTDVPVNTGPVSAHHDGPNGIPCSFPNYPQAIENKQAPNLTARGYSTITTQHTPTGTPATPTSHRAAGYRA